MPPSLGIAKAIEEEMVDRQGERTDLELQIKCTEVKGRETRDLVAEKSGFGNGTQRASVAANLANMRQGERTDLELRDKCPEG